MFAVDRVGRARPSVYNEDSSEKSSRRLGYACLDVTDVAVDELLRNFSKLSIFVLSIITCIFFLWNNFLCLTLQVR